MRRQMKKHIDEIIGRIVETAQPEQIILFGSYSRKDPRPDSDVDLLVIESEPFGSTRSRIEEISRLENAIGSIPMATDILVYSREEAERFRHAMNHIVRKAFSEGEVVYARY
jgi:predicted nucleotidyltransferase